MVGNREVDGGSGGFCALVPEVLVGFPKSDPVLTTPNREGGLVLFVLLKKLININNEALGEDIIMIYKRYLSNNLISQLLILKYSYTLISSNL